MSVKDLIRFKKNLARLQKETEKLVEGTETIGKYSSHLHRQVTADLYVASRALERSRQSMDLLIEIQSNDNVESVKRVAEKGRIDG
jgi:hypothetical protein